jgi:hypothetical protein
VEDASLLHVGAEAERDLVEIPPQHGAAPDGGAVVDGDLASEHSLRRDIGVHGYLWHPLPERHQLPLPAVVPSHPIRLGSCRAGGRRRRGVYSRGCGGGGVG